jgi:L-ribulose-5-phosphate 3-epimerase
MIPPGLIQGRLTSSNGRGMQFFPHGPGEWQREFKLAPKAGIAHIQWVCEPDSLLFTEEGQEAVRAVIKRTGVTVRNMDLHELLTKSDVVIHPDELFEKICAGLAAINGGTVELPLVEASSLLPKETYEARVAALRRFITVAKKYNVPVAVETDLGPVALAALVVEVQDISVVYDTGNSAGLGYNMEEEFAAYGSHISNVHIKDKPVGGMTVSLGTGSVNFPKLFSLLHKINYTGAVTLQAARGEDGQEVETIKRYVTFIQRYA